MVTTKLRIYTAIYIGNNSICHWWLGPPSMILSIFFDFFFPQYWSFLFSKEISTQNSCWLEKMPALFHINTEPGQRKKKRGRKFDMTGQWLARRFFVVRQFVGCIVQVLGEPALWPKSVVNFIFRAKHNSLACEVVWGVYITSLSFRVLICSWKKGVAIDQLAYTWKPLNICEIQIANRPANPCLLSVPLFFFFILFFFHPSDPLIFGHLYLEP